MPSFSLSDLATTQLFAGVISTLFRDGDVVELHGELGAGKTTLVGAIARELKALEPARSPTYTVAHRYELGDGRFISHLDCYRHEQGEIDDSAWGDLEPYFANAIALVEWPNALRSRLGNRAIWTIQLTVVDSTARVAQVVAPNGREHALLAGAIEFLGVDSRS